MSRKSRSRSRRAGVLTAVLAAGALSTLGTTPAGAVVGDAAAAGASATTARLVIGDSLRGCTGALIDQFWVISAASCFSDDPAQPQALAAGAPKWKTTATVGAKSTQVVELVPGQGRDLVMARLATPVQGVTPLTVGTSAPVAGQSLTVTGFGRTKSEWVPDKAHTGSFSLDTVNPTGVGITGTGGAAVCKGDTGAPVVREVNGKAELVAVASRSWRGGCLDTPATETRTGAYATRVDDLAAWVSARTSRSYEILNPASGRCLNLKGAGPTWPNSTEIIAWDCTLGASNEQFQLTPDGLLRNPASGRCLNVAGAGPWNNGNPVILFDCSASSGNEKFEWTADGQLRNPASNRCLNVFGAGPWANGTPIVLFDCNSDPNEKFQPVADNEIPHPVGRIKNPASDRCLNISGAGPTWPNSTPIVLFDCNGENNELFQLTADGLLYNYASNRCLNVAGAGPWNNGNSIILFDCSASSGNEKFEWTADGQLRNPASNRCLNVAGGGPVWNNNTPIVLWDCNGDPNEKFQLIAVQA
ncbi:hypothetical protein GCM10010519_25480 [Streptomyces lactacystinicus]